MISQAAVLTRGPTLDTGGENDRPWQRYGEGVLGPWTRVFRGRARPVWMVQPADRPPLASQTLDHHDVLTMNFLLWVRLRSQGPDFGKASP